MSTDIIEGEAVELDPQPTRAVVVAQPGQALVSADAPTGPVDMLDRAATIATALARMVEAQKLYTVIRGKKFPNVEAWQTIGRMDNVVAREASRPERNEDGSWEAFVELVRLSDGMVIGNGSAICGAAKDGDWTNRPDHEKRSMAVTRATSRAFRQQYAWIMALAGYQPTPADEMPTGGDGGHADHTDDDGLIGIAMIGKAQAKTDFELRQHTEHGWAIGFRLGEGNRGFAVYAFGALAEALATIRSEVIDQRVTCWGKWVEESFPKGAKRITYNVLHLERIHTAETVLPAPLTVNVPSGDNEAERIADQVAFIEAVAPGQEILPLDDDERAAIAGTLP